MNETDFRALDMVRRIRDEQAALLADKSEADILEFFRKAGEAALEDARRRTADRAVAK